MGKRGPHPKPTETSKRDGTYRSDRRRGEIAPKPGSVLPPKWLSKKAKAHWSVLSVWLKENGLLTVLDKAALGLLCDAFSHYLELRNDVEQHGWIETTDKGTVYQAPRVGAMNKARSDVIKLLREFGMTPSSRAGLAIANTEVAKDPMAELMERMAERRQHTDN